MTITVLFVQGAGEGTHDDWDSKLVSSLERELGAEYRVLYPRMPNEHDPQYEVWKQALLDQFREIEDGAVLVGHSVGGTVLLHLLAEGPHGLKPGAIMSLAAPFIGEGGWPSDDIPARADFAERLPKGVPVLLYHGTEDASVPPQHMDLYARAIPEAVVLALAGRDHQLNGDLSDVARDIRALSG